MVKKLLFLFLIICISYAGFAQDINLLDTHKKNDQSITSIEANPNPFSIATFITFYTNKDTEISLSIKDLLGNTIYSKQVLTKKGLNSIPFYRDSFPSGIYIYSLKSDTTVVSKRIIIQ